MSKSKALGFKCNVTLKCIWASDRSYVFKSDGDEGGEGEFNDDEEEEDDCKVEIPNLNGDDNEDDAPNNRQNSKLDSKMEPDDEGDIGEEEHPKKKFCKDKKKKHSSHNRKSKEEEEDLDEPEVPFIEQLRNVRYEKFCEDTDEANYIKGILLDLGSSVIPTQTQIDQSDLFRPRPSDKTAPVTDVSDTWMPILEEGLWLTTEAPDQMKHKDGTAPLYKFKDLLKLMPSAAGAWTAKGAKLALVAVVPPTTMTPLELAIGVEGLHTVATLCKVTIPKLSGDPEKKAKQFSFLWLLWSLGRELREGRQPHQAPPPPRTTLRRMLWEGLYHQRPDVFTLEEVRSHPERPWAAGGQQARGLPEQEEIAPPKRRRRG